MVIAEDKAKDLIEQVCREKGVFLLGVDLKGSGRNRNVKVTLDTEAGITLNECQEISSEISDMFYRKDVFIDGYNLEVSSPGVDKPLEQPFEYKRNIGRNLTVEYQDNDELKMVTGELKEYKDDALNISVGKESLQIPISRVKRAQVKLKW